MPVPFFNCTGSASLKRSPIRLSSKPPTPPTVPRTMAVITDENNLSEDTFFYAVRYISKDRGEQRRQRDTETRRSRRQGVMGCWNAGSEITPRIRQRTDQPQVQG